MTQTTQDPFAAGPADDDENPFGTPTRGSFPKPGTLLHKLLIMNPVKIEQVADRNNPGKMKDRATVDTVALDPKTGEEIGSYDAMYWSQGPIVKAARAALKSGRPTLGTLHVFPVLKTLDRYKTETELLGDEDIQRWLARGSGLPPMAVAWALEPATSEELALALKWWKARPAANPFG